jgi:ribose/xylose/arabinose/galactoside ABC-type transport system permease subunit
MTTHPAMFLPRVFLPPNLNSNMRVRHLLTLLQAAVGLVVGAAAGLVVGAAAGARQHRPRLSSMTKTIIATTVASETRRMAARGSTQAAQAQRRLALLLRKAQRRLALHLRKASHQLCSSSLMPSWLSQRRWQRCQSQHRP